MHGTYLVNVCILAPMCIYILLFHSFIRSFIDMAYAQSNYGVLQISSSSGIGILLFKIINHQIWPCVNILEKQKINVSILFFLL